MDNKKQKPKPKNSDYEEVSSKMVEMSEQEVDLIYRMHKLVGDRWGLIAGRIPGRTPAEIQRFWVSRNTADNGQET